MIASVVFLIQCGQNNMESHLQPRSHPNAWYLEVAFIDIQRKALFATDPAVSQKIGGVINETVGWYWLNI